jgi:hypothetical protein
MAMAEAWPTELRLDKDKRALTVSFDDGQSFALPAELLRVLSPSAEVQGHSEAQRVTVAGKKNVRIVRIEPVGNYAACSSGTISTISARIRKRGGKPTSPISLPRSSRASLRADDLAVIHRRYLRLGLFGEQNALARNAAAIAG